MSELVNADATKDMMFTEFDAMREAMRRATGADLAVIIFSGHGHLVDDDRFYLLPHGVDVGSTAALKASALSASDFHEAKIAGHGRVLLFIDACRSGGVTAPLDRSLRAMLAAPNLAVFTSSAAGELSVERSEWQNGAFTEALLEALGGADSDGDGFIRVSDLMRHLTDRVPALTGGKQRPEVEIRFEAKVFVTTADA